MLGYIDYETLEELSKGKGLNKIQKVFNAFIYKLADYLKIEPLYQKIEIKLLGKLNFTKVKNISILDIGVKRVVQNSNLRIEINENIKKFLPFVLLREACYSFIPNEVSDLVKICINQIVENNLIKLSNSKEWKTLIRDSLVDKDFIQSQLDKLDKFFKIEAREPLESTSQFFFKKMRENVALSQNKNVDGFYDVIFEDYSYKTSRSLFNSDIIETLRIIVNIFYEKKSFLSLSDYQILFSKFKGKRKINTDLSLRKFTENMQWINKCSSIAPSYDQSYEAMDIILILGILKFNPLLDKNKLKVIIEQWPFYHSPKFSENSFATEISLFFNVPRIYLKDLLKYFDRLEESGYIINKKLYRASSKTNLINLNYFTDLSNIKKIIDPNSIKYEKKKEIETIVKYSSTSHQSSLSFFDFIIIDRVRSLSVTGLTFDKRIETLNAIKNDIENEYRKHFGFNREFKESIDKLIKNKQEFLLLLERNDKKGFLYLYSQLNYLINYIDLIENILNEHPEISSTSQLQNFINANTPISQNIEDYILFRNKNIKKIIVRDFISLFFQSKTLFREELDKIRNYYNLLNACFNFKILDLKKINKFIKEPNLAEEIYQTREKRYENLFKPINLYKITNEKIESTIEALLNRDPPILKPNLINTILTSTFAKYYPVIILKDTTEVQDGLKKLKSYFPRIFIYKTTEIASKKNFIFIAMYFINIKEKRLFLSVVYSYFKDSIVMIKRYFWRGVRRRLILEPREFYDFENKKFFYSEEFFKQLLIYSKEILGEKMEWPKYSLNNEIQEFFWPTKQNIHNLVKTVKNRISHQKINFNLRDLEDFSEFRKNLETNLIERDSFKNLRAKDFFERYINSIKFLPVFQKFGFSQYCLYFRPFFYRSPTFEIDFRLLFINSFQNIKFPASIEPNPAIFGEYIFPFKTPNVSYLNWLVKSKKNVSEYCLFYKKKFYDIIHFNRNLTKEGWSYSSIKFKSYMQDILFNPTYDPKISGIREFDLNEKLKSYTYGQGTQEYEDLTQIYDTKSIDIKSFLGTRQYSKINRITELLKKKLIFPYISLKNLDFQDKVSIILPDTKPEFNKKIVKIFSFFNMCRIYEIEGEFFIYGFQQERSFENGLLIEIWFPQCELDEFFNIFDLIFHFLGIEHYVILTDLVNGETLLKSVYGNLDFLKKYNPLLNFKWNDKDKIWMNHKLFNEKFEPIFPDLIKKEKQ
jgi:hypothetical protein